MRLPDEAITLVNELPVQTDEGYEVNLRNNNWDALHFPIDDAGAVPPAIRNPAKFQAKKTDDSSAKIA